MVTVYPIVLTPEDKGYVVYIPDLDINTQGDDLPEALLMAREAIGAWCLCQKQDERDIPAPSQSEPKHEAGDFVSWIDIDLEKYVRAHDMTFERTNITLPRYLKERATEAGLNLSQELQSHLKEVLQLNG